MAGQINVLPPLIRKSALLLQTDQEQLERVCLWHSKLHKRSHLRAMQKTKGQREETFWSLWKQTFPPIDNILYSLLFIFLYCKQAQHNAVALCRANHAWQEVKSQSNRIWWFGGLLKVSGQWDRYAGNYCRPQVAMLYCATISSC